MCVVVLLRRPGHRWPLLMAANREEMADRPARAPGRHWPDRPEVRAGYDDSSGGSWLGINDYGVTAALLNRYGTLGPQAGKRSRGELVLEALDHADASVAAKALLDLAPAAYRGFNLIIADDQDAYWLRSDEEKLTVTEIPEGFSMFGAWDRNDPADPRVKRHLSRFIAAPVPLPEAGDWGAWQALLAQEDKREPRHGLSLHLPNGYGTRASSLIAVPTLGDGRAPIFLHADGPPATHPYEAVA